MRTEAQVMEMRDAFARFRDTAEHTLYRELEYDDLIAIETAMAQFNHNSQILSVLDWVLGADTLKLSTSAEPRQQEAAQMPLSAKGESQ